MAWENMRKYGKMQNRNMEQIRDRNMILFETGMWDGLAKHEKNCENICLTEQFDGELKRPLVLKRG